jgi:hypothetical protein
VRNAIRRPGTERDFLRLLDGIVGHLPSELAARLRMRLAGGHVVEVADAVVFAAVAGPVALTGAQIDLLITTLAGAGRETTMVLTIQRVEPAVDGIQDGVGWRTKS